MRRLPNNLAVCERRKSKHPLDEGRYSSKRILLGNVTFEQDSRSRQRQYTCSLYIPTESDVCRVASSKASSDTGAHAKSLPVMHARLHRVIRD